jgi:DNA adenine methylase
MATSKVSLRTPVGADKPSVIKPFLKWPGGKTQLLHQLLRLVPPIEPVSTYFEPMVGGGALFFALEPNVAMLSDKNEKLIPVYKDVKSHVEEVIVHLEDLKRRHHAGPEETYYDIRDQFNHNGLSGPFQSAMFIYLNKCCFNGLYRVNKRGYFNVPIGRYKNPAILQPEKLREASELLQGASLAVDDFEDCVQGAQCGDFVYIDPPYQPVSDTANFTAFTADGFAEDAQLRLARTVSMLADRGVRVMVSNSDHPFVRNLYRKHRIFQVEGRRSINSKGSKRGPVPELIITAGYDPLARS